MLKDYCPGQIDLAAGGVVGMNEDEDQSAARELYEELGIEEPNPKYLFKFPYQDDHASAWSYVYYQIHYGKVKPQESEIDALFFWDEEKIMDRIAMRSRITPDSLLAFTKFLPHWQEIKKKMF